MLKRAAIMLTVLLVLSVTGVVLAADNGEDAIEIRNLYINSMAFDDSPRRFSVIKDLLPNGKLTVKGKVVASGTKVEKLAISLDGKESWQPVTLRPDGSFQYAFRAEANHEYAIYIQATDGAGRTNDVQDTGKLIMVVNRNLQSMVKETMDKMFDAYRAKNSRDFMALVSPDFAGDDILLARAVRKDFTIFDSFSIRYSLSNTAVDPKGRVVATVTYNITAMSTRSTDRDGNVMKVSGTTQLTFKFGEQALKLYSVKKPVLFGFSDAENIATGRVAATHSTTLIVSPTGNVRTGSPNEESGHEPHHPHYYD